MEKEKKENTNIVVRVPTSLKDEFRKKYKSGCSQFLRNCIIKANRDTDFYMEMFLLNDEEEN